MQIFQLGDTLFGVQASAQELARYGILLPHPKEAFVSHFVKYLCSKLDILPRRAHQAELQATGDTVRILCFLHPEERSCFCFDSLVLALDALQAAGTGQGCTLLRSGGVYLVTAPAGPLCPRLAEFGRCLGAEEGQRLLGQGETLANGGQLRRLLRPPPQRF